jgi:hypothetical protein
MSVWMVALALLFSARGWAALVTLTDGSSVNGELKELENGDLEVTTGAGVLKIEKSKIRSVVKDGSPATTEGDMTYVNKVLERRKKFGNDDGLPRTSLIQSRQIAFSLGYLNWIGDGLAFGPTGSSSDFNTVTYGLGISNSFNDLVGWELWGDYGIGEKNYGTPGAGRITVQRSDISFMPRLQRAINLGSPEAPVMLIPHLGIGPVYSYISTLAPGAFVGGSAVGGAASAGLDLQFGPALIGLKYRHLLSFDTSGSLNSRNVAAGLPQLSMGWAF